MENAGAILENLSRICSINLLRFLNMNKNAELPSNDFESESSSIQF